MFSIIILGSKTSLFYLYVTPGSQHPPRSSFQAKELSLSLSTALSFFPRSFSFDFYQVLHRPFFSHFTVKFGFALFLSSRAFLLFPLLSPALTFFLVSPISSTYCRPPVSIMHLKWRRLKDQRLGLSLASLSIYPFSSGILQYKLDS